MGPIKVVLNNCLNQQNVIHLHIILDQKNATGPVKVVFHNCLIQQNVMQAHITLDHQMPRGQQSSAKQLSCPAECNTSRHNSRFPNVTVPIKVVLNKCLIQQNVIQVHITLVHQIPWHQ